MVDAQVLERDIGPFRAVQLRFGCPGNLYTYNSCRSLSPGLALHGVCHDVSGVTMIARRPALHCRHWSDQ